MQIESAAPTDFDAITRLLSAHDLPVDDLPSSHLDDFFVARADGNLVGVVGAELYGDVGLLRSLAVPPSHQKAGIGARLVDRLEQHARQQDVDTLYLLTTTAAGYFEDRGYERVARDTLPPAIQETEEATRLCPSTATCMRKRLRTGNTGA